MGFHAVELLDQGIGNRVVAFRESKVVDFDITEALEMKRVFDKDLYDVALRISI